MVTSTTSSVPEVVAPALGESDHDKAMLAKVGDASPAEKPQRPDDIPEKFWDAEKGEVKTAEMAKSYRELEQARNAPPKAPEQATPNAALDEATKAAAEAAKAAGGDTSKVDFDALSAEYAQSGSLSAEAYGKLEAAGLSKDLVDQFIQGQEAVFNNQVSEAFSLVGGQEQYTAMLDWGTKNLPPAEQAAFDRAVVADPATRNMAITAMKAKFEAAVGKDPQLIRPGAAPSGAAAGAYQSRAEVTADMRNPKYKSDPAFRAEVERKLASSNVF